MASKEAFPRLRVDSQAEDPLDRRSDQQSGPLSVEAVLFDLDGVLSDESAWRYWFVQLLRRVGLHAQPDTLFRAFHQDYLTTSQATDGAYWTAMSRFLRAAGLTRSQRDEVIAAGRGKRRQFNATARPLPGVVATLARLSASLFPLGVVCSGSSAEAAIDDQLQRLGLGGWLRTVASTSFDMSLAESQTVYETASQKLGADMSRAVFVSACPLAVRNANTLGMTTIAFNTHAETPADLHITHFSQLTQVLTCERTRLLAG